MKLTRKDDGGVTIDLTEDETYVLTDALGAVDFEGDLIIDEDDEVRILVKSILDGINMENDG